ncbi:hypothetical protein BRADI_2g52881v3 [Brachypodium distachyon]|uniref:VQ domain-containing protein n=2 Tax=Brachypodium distachyon TaxID=15368 RepID=I1HSN0_BRADI|nr:hypothetical protein BRADI_2g52881v3 [Brachypodium distachyon]
MDHRKQQQQRESPSTPRSGGGGRAPSSGKGAKAGGGGKKPIKVVYISNPMRVKTSAAGFRALVQELTGRDADPSKYSTDDDGGAAQELSPEGSAAAPGTVAAGYQLPDDVAAAAAFNNGREEEGEGYGEEDDIFRAQLLDNDYSVFSPPTLLYDYPPHSNKV